MVGGPRTRLVASHRTSIWNGSHLATWPRSVVSSHAHVSSHVILLCISSYIRCIFIFYMYEHVFILFPIALLSGQCGRRRIQRLTGKSDCYHRIVFIRLFVLHLCLWVCTYICETFFEVLHCCNLTHLFSGLSFFKFAPVVTANLFV